MKITCPSQASYPFQRFFIIICLLAFVHGDLYSQTDASHYSAVFKANKPYRIYLPADYAANPTKRYPVIYFFHGNKGDHRYLRYDGLNQLINNASVILVAWNGRSVPKDDRPYNVGYHSNINYPVQFKDYFLELVKYIDHTYRTIPDRAHRATIGHSMGGFMSFYLAGKYPQLIGTAVSSKGSPEFFVGYPNDHTLYSNRYLTKNLIGVKTRFHNGTTGEELVNLNTEVHEGAQREKDLDYTYRAYEGGHSMSFAEFTDAFDFVINSFQHPSPVPTRWHHADLYPSFEVWGYQVTSNLKESGFIELKGVTNGGLQIFTRKWQPDGILIPGVQATVKTAPVYTPSTSYTLLDYNKTTDVKKISAVTSDATGRVSFSVNYQHHIIGLYQKNGPPELVFVNHTSDKKGVFLAHKKPCTLQLRILNRGGSTASHVKVELSSTTPGVTIQNPVAEAGTIESGQLQWLPVDFNIVANNEPPGDGNSPYIRFNMVITDDNGHSWKDEFDAPVMYAVPEFDDIGIDDGDSEIYGSGNGNNIAEPGETVMIYQHSNRTRLYYDDPYIDTERLHDDLQPDKWGDGYALSSLIHISKDCPKGHVIRFLACYEIKEWKTIKRNVTWGVLSITVGEPEK